MAMTDFFYEFNKYDTARTADGIGGQTLQLIKRGTVQGVIVRKNNSEKAIGAEQTAPVEKYVFHTLVSSALDKGAILSYSFEGKVKFVRLISNPIINTAVSMQTDWMSFDAEMYYPTEEIIS